MLKRTGLVLVATFSRAGDAVCAQQIFGHDSNLHLSRKLAADLAEYEADRLFGRALRGYGSYLLSEPRTLSALFPRFGPKSADGEHPTAI